MANTKQQVDVEFKASGLAKLKTGWADFAGELLEPVAILAAGGTKAQAVWAGFRGVFLSKVLGPLGMVAGMATGFLLTTRKLVGEWRTVGLQGSKAIESLTLRFKPLLNSIDLARKRAREIFAFGAKTPFGFEESAEANKMLQAFTKGALAGKEGMTLVGDAAAVAGTGFVETARQVGRLYDGLMSGRPVGEATMRLQEMGLISGAVRNQIESMQAANVSGAEVWRVVEKELSRNKGAMDALSEALTGLEATYSDTKQQMESGFGDGFLEGEKAGVKSATQVMERLTPVAQYLGETFGTVSNYWAKAKARLMDLATGFPGFSSLVSAAALTVWGLSAALMAATGGAIAKFLFGVISAAAGNRQLAASAGSAAAAQAAQGTVSSALAAAQTRLAAASAAASSGQYVQAAAHLRAAVAGTVAAVRTNALAASQGILRGALTLTGRSMVFVTRQLIGMAVAIMATPMFWIAGALTAAALAALHFHNASKKAREELEAYAKSSRAVVANLQSQIREIKTVSDLRRAEADAVRELAQAHHELIEAQQEGSGDKEAVAARKLQQLQAELNAIRTKPASSLDKDGPTIEREDRLRDDEKSRKESRAEFEAGRGPQSEEQRARAKLAELESRKAAAEKAMEAERALAEQQTRIQREVADQSIEKPLLMARAERLRSFIDKDRPKHNWAEIAPEHRIGAAKTLGVEDDLIAWESAKKSLADIEAALGRIDGANAEAGQRASRLALESDSELARLRERVKLFDELKSSADAVAKASQDAAEAKDEDVSKARIALAAAEQQAEAAKVAADAAGITPGFSRQDTGRQIERIERERTDHLNPAAIEEARQRVVSAELGLAQARLDAEGQIAGLRFRGYERERAMLEIEREKLRTAMQHGRIDADAYSRSMAVLSAQEAAMERNRAEQKQMLATEFQLTRLRRQEGEARDAGNTQRERDLRTAADALEDARTRQEAEKEALETEATPGARKSFVDARVAEAKAARESERGRELRDRELARRETLSNLESQEASMKAMLLRRTGQSDEAKRVLESAAKKEASIRKEQYEKELRGKGYDAQSAKKLAGRQGDVDELNRLMGLTNGGGGRVVADSLAQVGAGGGVAGNDGDTETLKKIEQLLRRVADNTEQGADFKSAE